MLTELYYTTDSELTYFADCIRNITGISNSSISFPQGFIDIIQNIQTFPYINENQIVFGYSINDFYPHGSFWSNVQYTYNDIITSNLNIPNSMLTNLSEINYSNCKTIDLSFSGFKSCRSLQRVFLPALTNSLPASFFQGCINLKRIELPKCQGIGSSAFQGCQTLTKINFPSCESIGEKAFFECTNLASVNFSNCSFIGIQAFKNCTKLKSVTLDGLNNSYSIGSQAFETCPSLKEINLLKCNQIGQSVFNYCTSLSKVILGSNCSSIPPNAFAFCASEFKLYLYYSDIVTLQHINAFYGEAAANLVLYNLAEKLTVYVKSELISNYSIAPNWNTLLNYRGENSSPMFQPLPET